MMKMNEDKKLTGRQKLEYAFVLLLIPGLILWGCRLLFITYGDGHWLGTLGVTSGVLGMIIFLSWKNKLGWYGRKYKEAFMHKLTKKFRKMAMIVIAWNLISFSIASAGLHMSQGLGDEVNEVEAEIEKTDPDLLKPTAIQDKIEDKISGETGIDIVGFFVNMAISLAALITIIFTDFHVFAILMGVVNNIFQGHLVHLVDIFLIEEIEFLGLFILMQFIQKRTKTLSSSE